MTEQDVILYKVKGKVATITLNRPKAAHSFNLALMKGLYEKLEQADKDEKVKCILLQSTGNRVFSAGIDIKSKSLDENQEYFDKVKKYGRLNNQKILLMKKPVVAKIQGTAIGYGMELVMAADLRLFADKPKDEMFFRMPEIAIGIYPQTGATILPLLAFGFTNAKKVLFTSDKLSLDDLRKMNFPTRIFPLERLDVETKKFMRTFSKRMGSFMFLIKSSLNIMHTKHIERWFDLEDECGDAAYDKKTQEKFQKFIEDLYKKYP
ncbi:MAG: putative 3-hydroxypropionyl-coenzyme A dehydratase [Promethearchaeota archaeon]|nr:MAG: putative 3-hydroxypropionyl-coenzyme A dehydratase [Candidatus Lokiarchaeota archaeon]